MSDSNLYTERLLRYWDQSLRGFPHQDYTHGASASNLPCDDEVEFRVKLVGGGVDGSGLAIVDVWARGCCMVECCAAMLAELARGKSLAWLDTFTNRDWVDYVNIPVSASRKESCLMLPLNCLRKTVDTPYVPMRRLI